MAEPRLDNKEALKQEQLHIFSNYLERSKIDKENSSAKFITEMINLGKVTSFRENIIKTTDGESKVSTMIVLGSGEISNVSKNTKLLGLFGSSSNEFFVNLASLGFEQVVDLNVVRDGGFSEGSTLKVFIGRGLSQFS